MPPTEIKHKIVAYHKDCLDGLAAAWAVAEKHKQDESVTLDYVSFSHHQQEESERLITSALKPHSEMLFVDVAPRVKFLETLLSSQAASIRIIDHHKSAFENLKGITAPKLDMKINPDHPSAAHMVWEDMHDAKPRPVFFDMIARMDVKTNLVTNDDFAAAAYIDSKSIRSIDDAFRSFGDLSRMTLKDIAAEGSGLYRDQYNRITKLGDNVMYTRLDLPDIADKWIPVVNADVQNFGRSISQYLRELGERAGSSTAFAWYMQGNGKITMSIRSDGSPDASSVARHLCQRFGIEGGGHDTSAAVHFASLTEFARHISLTAAENTGNTRLYQQKSTKP